MDTRYVYKTLPSPRHIRLLRLYGGKKSEGVSCELSIVSLDEALSFEALSYTWGNPLPRMPVRCSGKTTEIGQSLHSALRCLRHESNTRILWADALCINQEDIQERNAQVRLMGEIYGKAEKTLIWLGEDPDEQIYELFQALEAFQETLRKKGITIFNFKEHDQYNNEKEVFREVISSHSRMVAVKNLFEHPWFGRKWIIQELVNSRNPVVISGMNCLPWHILESFATLLRWTRAWVVMGLLDLRSKCKDHVLNAISLAQIRREKDTFSLADHIHKTLSFDCTQPHDHLIAILGLARNSDKDLFSSLSDYSIHETELWWRYASIAIKSGSLTPLLLVDTLPLADRPISWVADLSRLSQSTKSKITSILGIAWISRTLDEITSQNFTKSFSYFSNASGTTAAAAQISDDGRILSVEGVFVGQVEEMTSREMPMIGEDIQFGTFYSMPGKCGMQQKIWNEALSMAFRGISHKNRAKRIRAWTECTRAWMFDVNDNLSMAYLQLYHLAKKKWHLLSDPRIESIGKVPFRPDDRTMAEMNELYKDETFRKILRADRPAVGHHFCRTTGGWLGWVTLYSRPGDRIYIIRGSRVPHVLRPSGDGTYKLIGQCYIQGVMNGEYLMCSIHKKETIWIS